MLVHPAEKAAALLTGRAGQVLAASILWLALARAGLDHGRNTAVAVRHHAREKAKRRVSARKNHAAALSVRPARFVMADAPRLETDVNPELVQMLELLRKSYEDNKVTTADPARERRRNGEFWVLYRHVENPNEARRAAEPMIHEMFAFEMPSKEEGEKALRYNAKLSQEQGWRCVQFKDTPYMAQIDKVLHTFPSQKYDVQADINESLGGAAPAPPSRECSAPASGSLPPAEPDCC